VIKSTEGLRDPTVRLKPPPDDEALPHRFIRKWHPLLEYAAKVSNQMSRTGFMMQYTRRIAREPPKGFSRRTILWIGLRGKEDQVGLKLHRMGFEETK
jgi:hypothetical protein